MKVVPALILISASCLGVSQGIRQSQGNGLANLLKDDEGL